ncbi:MAG: hypothetical protein KIT69_06005 [Propionibacteriaceae bacterium]|nr:hypothetical protein [Propionibacteriaceae bacterium]
MNDTDYVRVTDAAEETGNAWTTLRAIAEADGLKILTADDGKELPALDLYGTPLAPSRIERVAEPAVAPPAEDAPVADDGKPKTNRVRASEPATDAK